MKKIKLNEEQLVQELTPEQATQPVEASPTEVANAQAAPVEEASASVEEAPAPAPEEAPVAAPAEEAPVEEAPVEETPEVAAAPIDEVPAGMFKAPVEGMVPSGWIFPEEMAAAVAQQTGDLEAAGTAPDAVVEPKTEAPINESIEDMDEQLDNLIAQMRAADKDGNEAEVERCKTEMLKLLGKSLQEECEEKMEEKSVEEIVAEDALEPGEAHPEDRDDLDDILADFEADYEAEKAAIEEAHPSLKESIEEGEIEELPTEIEGESEIAEAGKEEACPECGKNPCECEAGKECVCEDGNCEGCEAEEVVKELADDLEAAEEPAEVLDATADFLRKIFGDVEDEEEAEDEEEFDFAKYFGNISDEDEEELEESTTLRENTLHDYVFLFSDGYGAASRGLDVDTFSNVHVKAEDLNNAAAEAWSRFKGFSSLEEWADDYGYEPEEVEEIKADVLGYIDGLDITGGDPWVEAIKEDDKIIREPNEEGMEMYGYKFDDDEDAYFWGLKPWSGEDFDEDDEDFDDEEFEEKINESSREAGEQARIRKSMSASLKGLAKKYGFSVRRRRFDWTTPEGAAVSGYAVLDTNGDEVTNLYTGELPWETELSTFIENKADLETFFKNLAEEYYNDEDDEEFEESIKSFELKEIFYPAGSKKAEEVEEDEVKAYKEASEARKAALNSFTEKINRKRINESKKAFRSALNESYRMTEEEAEDTWESKKLSEKEDRAFSWSEYLQKYNN